MPQFDDYRGHAIYYERDRFVAYQNNAQGRCTEVEIAAAVSLSEIHKAIDTFLKKRTRGAAIKLIGIENGRIETGRVTSIVDDGRCWIHWASGRNEKCYRNERLVLDTPENRTLMQKVMELTEQIDALDDEKEKTAAAYVMFEPEPEKTDE